VACEQVQWYGNNRNGEGSGERAVSGKPYDMGGTEERMKEIVCERQNPITGQVEQIIVKETDAQNVGYNINGYDQIARIWMSGSTGEETTVIPLNRVVFIRETITR